MSVLLERILLLSIVVFLLNLPFGYWRTRVKKKSFQWFLAIHIPIPFVIALRFLFHIGFVWYSYPFVVLFFFLGQWLGGRFYRYKQNNSKL